MPRHHRRLRTPNRQFDLFAEKASPPGLALEWSALPDQTRHALIGLMTRLLIAHADGETHEPGSDADER